jgi:delta 1-pyrroline-5-carboxylate dehydrogenase
MKRNLLAFPAAVFLLLLSLAAAAYAHHGIASWFDMTHSATVKGTVTGFDWTNPHSYIYLDVKAQNGAAEKWTAEMGSVGTLVRAGWRRNTLKPGDEITMVGKVAKDGKPRMLLDKIILASGQELAASDVPTPTIP